MTGAMAIMAWRVGSGSASDVVVELAELLGLVVVGDPDDDDDDDDDDDEDDWGLGRP